MTTKKPTLLIRMDKRTKDALKKAADFDRRSMAFLAEELILEGLRQRKQKKREP